MKTASATAEVDTRGARVVSCVLGGEEILWNDDPVQIEAEDWAHGGIPVCWPWFGKEECGAFHGTAWKNEFRLVNRSESAERSELELAYREGEGEIVAVLTLTDRLRIELRARNHSTETRAYSFGIHPYFRVGERDMTFVHGYLKDPVQMSSVIDKSEPIADPRQGVFLIEDRARGLSLSLVSEGYPRVNLWNPGALAPGMPGSFKDDGWRRFVCLEPLWSMWTPCEIAAGGECRCATEISIFNGQAKPVGAAKTHFAGADPRVPGMTSKVFAKKPFKVMFIGAHPDDPDIQCGALAHKVKKAGGEAVFVSCCNGNKGHQWMDTDALAARRYLETQASAKALGIDRYLVLDYPDCEIRADQELQDRLTRLIRKEAPNMLVTHRTCDYHVDHRNVGIAVRDATYLIGVPLYCPDTAVPEVLPFVMYGGDDFREPAPFRADLACGDDDVLDVLLEAWAAHESQMFEWLPPEAGIAIEDVPKDHAGRIRFLRERMMPERPTVDAIRHRKELDAAWGGKGPQYVEVFELCPYARKPVAEEIEFLRSVGCKWLRAE